MERSREGSVSRSDIVIARLWNQMLGLLVGLIDQSSPRVFNTVIEVGCWDILVRGPYPALTSL